MLRYLGRTGTPPGRFYHVWTVEPVSHSDDDLSGGEGVVGDRGVLEPWQTD